MRPAQRDHSFEFRLRTRTRFAIRRTIAFALCTAASVTLICIGDVIAGGVTLKSDFQIEGKPIAVQAISTTVPKDAGEVTVYPVTMIDAGMQRYYVPTRNVLETLKEEELGLYEKFMLPQRQTARTRSFASIPRPIKITAFDDYGRRTVTFPGPRGPIDVEQGIFEIGPRFMRARALTFAWEFGIATTSIPNAAVDRMIRNVTDQQKPEDRFAIARFYAQAELYLQALVELESIEKDFPELKDKVKETTSFARQQLAQRLLNELTHRRERGQHQLAYNKANQFPTEKMSTSINRQVREFIAEYDQAIEQAEMVLARLGELQGELEGGETREAVEAMRFEVSEKLNYESLARLRPFLQQHDDPNRPAEEKLALAYSGWVLGEAEAVDSLSLVVSLWQARFEMLRYLRSPDSVERAQILADLTSLEGIGPNAVLALIPNLPPILSTAGIRPGVATEVIVDNKQSGVPNSAPEVRYSVLLPTEYTPDKTCPVIVALHAGERTRDWELRWWGGTAKEPLQAQRHGYIVIAPDYLEGESKYGYGPMSHYRVLMSLRDARKRFQIDSDRVFLSGHGSGGDAAFDIGCAHADVFAGVIPITGRVAPLVRQIGTNGRNIPWYVVSGQLDRDVFESNVTTLDRWMKTRFDVVLTEYIGRGYESYYSEIHRLFSWMELHSRQKLPFKFNMLTMRPNNNRFYWLKAHLLESPSSRTNRVATPPKAPMPTSRPRSIRGEILDGKDEYTAISISSPARSNTVWLSPEMIDFNKRLQLRVGNRRVYNDFVESSVEVMLDDLRIRGDRQKIFHAKIEVN